jgi:hypothetical protein
VAEVLLAILLVALLVRVVRGVLGAWRRRVVPWRPMAQAVARTAAAVGTGYAAFLLLWGLNYQRQPLATRLSLPVAPAEVRELTLLSESLVLEANRGREGLPEDGDGALALSGGLRDALVRVQPHGPRPKPAVSSVALSYLGISGIFVPFTGEATVNALVPACEVPFAAAHELAHRAGTAREDEANFEAYRTCRGHADPIVRYSGTFGASLYALSALRGVDPAADERLRGLRTPAVARDVRAVIAWNERYRSPLGAVQWRVNDTYLRSQGQPEGMRSYGRMVDLMLAERRAAVGASPAPVPPQP